MNGGSDGASGEWFISFSAHMVTLCLIETHIVYSKEINEQSGVEDK